MKLAGAMLADSATAVNGKLDVSGGVARYFKAGHDRVARITLVVLTRFEAHDSAPKLTVEFVRPSGDSQAVDVDVPVALAGSPEGEMGFAIWPLWMPVEEDGEYSVVVREMDGGSDGDSISLPLTVRS